MNYYTQNVLINELLLAWRGTLDVCHRSLSSALCHCTVIFITDLNEDSDGMYIKFVDAVELREITDVPGFKIWTQKESNRL